MSGSYKAVIPGKLKLKKPESGPLKSIGKNKKRGKDPAADPADKPDDKNKTIEKTTHAVDDREKKKSDRYCK